MMDMEQERTPLPTALLFWSGDMLNKFGSVAQSLRFQKGDTILHPLMRNQSLFLVESGIVDYRYFSREGDAVTVLQIRAGEMFGLKSIFMDEERDRRYFYVVANTEVRLWKITRDRFLALMESDFDFTQAITQYFVRYITQAERKIIRAAILDNYQNMVLMLLDYAEDIRDNKAVVQMTQQNLADLLNVSRQSVSGYLRDMSQQGLIRVKRGKIYILNWDALLQEML